jgi:PAS domain S-box-containing protein
MTSRTDTNRQDPVGRAPCSCGSGGVCAEGCGAADEQFRGLLESAPDAMVIVDETGAIRLVNTQTEALFGYGRQELLGRPVEALVPSRFHDRHAAHRTDYAHNQQFRPMGAGLDLYGLRKDGEEFPVEISLSPLRTQGGVLFSAAVRDVTERKAAEAELTRLYEQQRHVALTLQRSLMGTPPDVPGLLTASRYLPATQGAGVGGDWFDLVPLESGKVGVLIGDVMGRGLEAAAVMGRLRSAANALARTGMPPRRLMEVLDAVVIDLAGQLVTCCYLVIDPGSGEITLCSAGHLPVLLATPELDVLPLPAPVNVPLGVSGFAHEQATHTAPPGSTLALYTDGLVETPDTDIEKQVTALAAELGTALGKRQDLETVADSILSALLPASAVDDDVTLLLAQVPPRATR